MNAAAVHASIRAELLAHAEPHKLPQMQRFFREPIDAYCTYTEHVRNAARDHAGEFRAATAEERQALTELLWDSGKFEEGAVAIHLYARMLRHCGEAEWRIWSGWLDRRIHNWAHCDTLCADVLGPLLIRRPEWITKLEKWPLSRSLYKRRAALVAPLKGVRKGLFRDELAAMLQSLAADPDDLMKKARKWARVELTGRKPRASRPASRTAENS